MSDFNDVALAPGTIDPDTLERLVLAEEAKRNPVPGVFAEPDLPDPEPVTHDVESIVYHSRVYGRPATRQDLMDLLDIATAWRTEAADRRARIQEELDQIAWLEEHANNADTAIQNVTLQLQGRA